MYWNRIYGKDQNGGDLQKKSQNYCYGKSTSSPLKKYIIWLIFWNSMKFGPKMYRKNDIQCKNPKIHQNDIENVSKANIQKTFN